MIEKGRVNRGAKTNKSIISSFWNLCIFLIMPFHWYEGEFINAHLEVPRRPRDVDYALNYY